MNAKVDKFINTSKQWKEETKALRAIVLESGLTEEMKWGQPTYTYEGTNVVMIQLFKEFLALMFFKGALLKDPKKVMAKPGDNSQSARRFEFTEIKEIHKLKSVMKSYLKEAIAAEKAGLKVDIKKTPLKSPEELQKRFKAEPALKKAFEALTPGRQRAYIIFFSGAKQSQTRESRIEKCEKRILKGKGLNDP